MKNVLKAIVLVTLVNCAAGCSSNSLYVGNLKCENRVNPVGIENISPRLSWILESKKRNQDQDAYHILVSDNKENLNKNIGDIWIHIRSALLNRYWLVLMAGN